MSLLTSRGSSAAVRPVFVERLLTSKIASVKDDDNSLADKDGSHRKKARDMARLPMRIINKARDKFGKTKKDTKASANTIFGLPPELQFQILRHLELHDLLQFRLASCATNALVKDNGHTLACYYAKYTYEPYQLALLPMPSSANLSYILDMNRRIVISTTLSHQLAEFVAHKIIRLRTPSSRKRFQSMLDHLQTKMVPLIFLLTTHFERYRTAYVRCVMGADGRHPIPRSATPHTAANTMYDIECTLMEQYDTRQLLHAHLMYVFLISAFGQRLSMRRSRPRAWLLPRALDDKIERLLHGPRALTKTPPEHIAGLLVLGGLGQLGKVLGLKSTAKRRDAIYDFNRGLQSAEVPDAYEANWARLGLGGWEEQSRRDGDALEGQGDDHARGLFSRQVVEELAKGNVAVPHLAVVWKSACLTVLRERGRRCGTEEVKDFVVEMMGYQPYVDMSLSYAWMRMISVMLLLSWEMRLIWL
ncbi:hypothetical protein BDY21DRAFT_189303 [Lineolata rhizophorae]|uniref:F-box domain-containing protein n=1 Tax=Lineolata rhizophorae TaxID=578093 RepID=A0A6A6P691_9PEZI|nr:hypothetical protein BDY21DRAFT_189303 [Lineolata rhizophorae]